MFISCSGRSGAYCILPGRRSYVYLYRYTLNSCFGGSELNLFFFYYVACSNKLFNLGQYFSKFGEYCSMLGED